MPFPLPIPAICLVSSGAARERDAAPGDILVELAARASDAGVDVVQIREPRLGDGALAALVGRVADAVDRGRTAVLVNDRPDVALAAGADGVHLRASAMAASRVRAIAPRFLIGRSVHSAMDAREAEADGAADFLIFGTVFPSAGKPAGHPVAGVAALAGVCGAVRLPVLAIGGVQPDLAADAAAAGAAGVAAIGMFEDANRRGADGLRDLVRRVRQAFDSRRPLV